MYVYVENQGKLLHFYLQIFFTNNALARSSIYSEL